MADTRTLAKALGQTAQSTNTIKPQLGDRPDVYTYLRTRYERVSVVEISMDVATRSLAGDGMIWGNVDFGIYNLNKWANGASTSFVLGHSVAGVLGTSRLGTQSSSYIINRVVNPSNTYTEEFNNDTFKDVATTADWATTPGQCDFTIGEIAQSEIFALNNETYVSLTLTAKGTTLTNLTFQVRFDGSNWENVTRGIAFTSTFPSAAGIEWKATAIGNATLTRVRIGYST